MYLQTAIWYILKTLGNVVVIFWYILSRNIWHTPEDTKRSFFTAVVITLLSTYNNTDEKDKDILMLEMGFLMHHVDD
jgi:hypothetical protein